MNHHQDIALFLKTQEDYTLMSIDTPLISNLNMVENIGLIKEFHEDLSIQNAEQSAQNYLQKIELAHISERRLHQCSLVEIFYVMFIRAIMTKEMDVIIVAPLSLMGELEDMKNVIENLIALNNNKNILIIDTIINEIHYKGCLCHIVK